ncbi:ParB/RepB/Spo0J family partition protein [Amycolatopsis sp.]|uniref:ParB/RepB/Spo0J family partition protein n=1 Tax=Amycolatopsis sp. TaxID=37632 RepID=UPI002D80104C|nr:winged helix-turn-helix transcriptional regulator [Amycolatopsis sp.]HET6704888.1 winged helix-turn-helix transcriptional regulator [Amycolatopsis sp.]
MRDQLDGCPTAVVDIESLRPADSPRSSGEDAGHTQVLAESEEPLPPIVVHGPSMKIIDGMHRVHCARVRGHRVIEAKIYNGDDKDAFVLAVRLNVTHGLPLTSADRCAAAARIVASHPRWSNRMIATMAGIAPTTVAQIRRRSVGPVPPSDSRVGQDGRTRPVDAAAGREKAHELLIENPGASLRAIARQAGISPATVRDVRRRLEEGRGPVPDRRRRKPEEIDGIPLPRSAPASVIPHSELGAILDSLKKDPAFRFSQKGRSLLRWLDQHLAGMAAWHQIARDVPPHGQGTIAKFLHIYADAWKEFAIHVEDGTRQQSEEISDAALEADFHRSGNPLLACDGVGKE